MYGLYFKSKDTLSYVTFNAHLPGLIEIINKLLKWGGRNDEIEQNLNIEALNKVLVKHEFYVEDLEEKVKENLKR